MNDISHSGVLSPASIHWLLEYFLSAQSGGSSLVNARQATQEAGGRPDTEILRNAARYYREARAEDVARFHT